MNIKGNKGVTLIALVVTVMILLIITGTLIYSSKNQVALKKLNNLYIDIENINSKIDQYYLDYGELPILSNYLNKTEFMDWLKSDASSRGVNLYSEFEDEVLNPNDGDEYFVIDLEKLEGLTLNYGYDTEYSDIKSSKNINTSDVETEIYVINKVTHQIYFPHGILVDGFMYYMH